MAFFHFNDTEPYTLAGGFTLNLEERTCLQTSLLLKKDEEKLDNLTFWGKIQGVTKDYYIAQSWKEGEWFKKKLFYTQDLTTWLQLPHIEADDAVKIEKLNGRFMGEPSHEYTLTEDGEPAGKMTEEKRLAGTVAIIDYDAQVVPRGAYYRDAAHKIQLNKLNSGLSSHELGQLASYLHFRAGFSVDAKLLIEKAENFEESIDIFEPLTRDEPKGCWSIQVERGSTLAIARSLAWPGYLFYHRPAQGTTVNSQWGGVYCGTGQRNENIGYML